MARKGWHIKEEEFLRDNYANMTIKELQGGLLSISGRPRTEDSINAKIKRMKDDGIITWLRNEDTITRSLKQRRKTI